MGIVLLLACGCARKGPQGAGTIRKLEAGEAAGYSWHVPPRSEGDAELAAPGLIARVAGIVGQDADLKAVYSLDASSALVVPCGSGSGEVAVWFVTASRQQSVSVELPPQLDLRVLWSPHSRDALILPDPYQTPRPDVLVIICLRLADGGRIEVGTGTGPSGSGQWAAGPFRSDGSMLFFFTGGPGAHPSFPQDKPGELWTVELPDCKFSLLYTQPAARWPPHVQKEIARRGSDATPVCHKMNPWGGVLESPGGQMLVFQTYPPDDYLSEALWLLNLRTRQCRQVTWEDKGLYKHYPISWNEGDSSLIFERYEAEGLGYYQLTFDADLWDPRPGDPE